MPERFRSLSSSQERAFERIASGEERPKGVNWLTLKSLLRRRLIGRCAATEADALAVYVRPAWYVPEGVQEEYLRWLTSRLA